MSAVVLVWRCFICRACGLIYDEAKGDADSGLAPGTRFDDIPDDWCCPLCGVTKADFEPFDASPPARHAAPQRAAGTRRNDAGVVIVGAGRAGWQMAQALRERDAEVPITLVTACDGALYDKPLLSVALAKGLALDDLVKEPAAGAARRLNVRLLPRTHAVSVAPGSKQLRTTRGSLRYRQLVLAHGAAPRDVPQLPGTLCWRINHLDAYLRLRRALGLPQDASHDTPHHTSQDSSSEPAPDAPHGAPPHAPPKRIVIAGAGLVGCELANDLALAGVNVTLLEAHALPLAALLSEADSHALLAAWQGLPLQFVGGVRIAGVTQLGPLRTVHTEDGRRFEAEHVIAATGLQTPSRLASSAGLAWEQGIVVDACTLRTSVVDIHALGDCISIAGRPHRYIEPIARQARVIAGHLTGGPTPVYESEPPPVRVKTTSRPFTV